MKPLKLINPENASEEEVKNYQVREAGRAVVLDNESMVALLHVTKENYYKLPGGGLEDEEDKIIALKRECIEEIGCDIEVTNEIGTIVEYRKIFSLKQISYCYLAKIKGEKGIPDFTEKEKEGGFEVVWVGFDEAMKLVSSSKAENLEGSLYIVPRETEILSEAKNLL